MKILALIFAELSHLLFSVRRARKAFGDLADGAEALLAADVPLEDAASLPEGVTLPEAIQSRLGDYPALANATGGQNGKSRGRKKATT